MKAELLISKCPKCGNDTNMERFGLSEVTEWRCNSCGGHFKIKGEVIELPDEPITETFARMHKDELIYETGIIGNIYYNCANPKKPEIVITGITEKDQLFLMNNIIGKRQYVQFSRLKSW